MNPKPHLAAASAFWAELGVSVEEQHQAAAWAFVVPVVAAEPGRAVLWENTGITWTSLGEPARVDRRPALLADLALMLAEFAEL